MKKYNHMIKHLLTLLLLFTCAVSFAQNNTENAVQAADMVIIRGQVLDVATKLPVLGAKVQSNNRLFSSMSDENGAFEIQLPAYINQLHVTAPEYAPVQYSIQGKTEMKIMLSKEQPPFGSKPAITIDDELPYLSKGYVRAIKHSGTPGIGSSMFIRGLNSLNVGAQPLIIVDGVIFDNQYDRLSIHDGFLINPLANIDVDDIESIEVINDGASLYGAKEGNGVVLIHTKRGKDQVTKITVNTKFGYNFKPETTPMLNADQYRVYASDIYKIFDPTGISSLPFLNEDKNYYDYERYHNSNDWTKDVYRNSFTQSYNVGVSGGDNAALYHLSMGYADAKSTLKENDFRRFNVRFNSDVELTEKFKISFDLSYAQTDRNLRDDGFNESTNALITAPSVLSLIKSPFLIPYEYSNDRKVTASLSDEDIFNIANPVSIIENGIGESDQNHLTISVRPSYQFTKSLKLSTSFNYSMNSLFEKYFRPDAGVPNVYLDRFEVSKNFVKAQNEKQISLAANVFLNWNRQFNIHAFDVTGGWRFLNDTYKGDFGSGHNTASDLDHNLSGSLLYRNSTGYDDRWRSFTGYATAGYTLSEKYMLSASLVSDASSRFGEDADMAFRFGGVNWGLYPAVNASWLISSEKFMRNVAAINLLKLKAGYAVSGNDNIPQSAAQTYFSAIRYINQYTGTGITNIGNSAIKPETVKKATVGLDVTLLNNSLTLSAGLFHHTTSDLLVLKQFDEIVGLENYWTNDGKLQNKGFEIALDARVYSSKKFRWDVGVKVAHYKNEILELPDGNYTTSIYGGEIQTAVGQAAGVFYGYKTDGVFATSRQATEAGLKMADPTGIGYYDFTAGDVHFADLHKDGIIDDKDKTVIGDPNPELTGMFHTRFAYKRLSLNALFTFSYGNDIYNYMRSQLESGSGFYNQTSAMQNRWVSEGMQTGIPKISYGDVMGNSRFSDRWIEDGSYLRLKSLSLSYDVPVNWVFLSGFTVWASVENLFTLTKYLGGDPEVSVNNSVLYQGIDVGLLSQGKSVFVGLKLNL